MTKFLILFSAFFISLSLCAQDIGIGGWKDHLSYKNAISVTEGNGKVFCASTSGVFALNKLDNSMDRLSKVNGLSDVEATIVNYNKYNNRLLIAYKNSNIDVVEDNGSITNISDIKRKSIIGNKTINHVYFVNQFAYLSCGFGIVVLDMDRLEVKDTYYIGPGGAAINVNSITSDGTKFYAATSIGIFTALMNNPNLANYTSWQKDMTVPHKNEVFNAIAAINGKLVVNYQFPYDPFNPRKDTLFIFDGTTWNYFNYGIPARTFGLSSKADELILAQEGTVLTYNANLTNTGYYSGYFSGAYPNAAVIDVANTTWIADANYGLVSYNASRGFASTYPNGPASPKVFEMALSEGNLWVAPGSKSATYFADGLYHYSDGEWKNPRGNYPGVVNMDTVLDVVNVIVDPNDPKRAYASSWARGLVEFYNDVPVKLYNSSNSGIKKHSIASNAGTPIWVDGLAFDSNNNLWVANSGQRSSLAIKTSGGSWHSIDVGDVMGTVSAVQRLGKMIIDKNDQKWVIFQQGGDGIMVFNGGPTSTSDATNTKKLSTAAGNGLLPSSSVASIVEDLDGEIWIGTDKGIGVFYTPENVFSGGNFDAQQILIEQDGHVQILLETENVQAIAVDDANRKWIGTSNSGVFLMSADGTTQINHFDIDNSPLLSNNVKSIVIDHNTGEIYFGTDKGIIAYRGTATKGLDEFADVYSFPNPVKPDYTGPIAIKGLVANTIVKITDISGSLVYETKSEGGQAIWYGKNFAGEKVSTGVYMVFCASEDGSQKIATKILFIN